MDKQKWSKKRLILFIVCLAVAVAALAYAVVMTVNRSRSESAYDELREMVQSTAVPTPTPTNTPKPTNTPVPTATPEPVVELDSALNVNFDDLRATNGDICAWLDIPDTDISYPVLRSDTDDYYLMRNLDGSYGYPGCIYINTCNTGDFTDFANVLYGHNMKDGTMFAHLKYFFDADYLAAHRRLLIYTPEKILVYRVMVASDYDNRYIPESFDFTADQGRTDFLTSLTDTAAASMDDLPLAPDGRYVTLSTCTYTTSRRVLVTAVFEGVGQVISADSAEDAQAVG